MSTVMGIDAGFAHMGIVVAQGRKIIYAHTEHTEKNKAKKAVRVADDDTERCQSLARILLDVIHAHRPAGAIAEMPGGGAQGARPNRTMGMATATVAAVLEVVGIPLEVVTPQAVKKATTGRNDGAKEEVEAAVKRLFEWAGHLPKTKKDREHVADAAAALIAAENGMLMRALAQRTKGA